MIAVGIIGLLAVAAQPTLTKLQIKARRAEVTVVLNQISKLSATARILEEPLPWSSTQDETGLERFIAGISNGAYKYSVRYAISGGVFRTPIITAASKAMYGTARDELVAVPGWGIIVCEDGATGATLSSAEWTATNIGSLAAGVPGPHGRFTNGEISYITQQCVGGNVSIP